MDTSATPQHEAWMTPELQQKLRDCAPDNTITCDQVQQFARDNNIEITRMKPLVDLVGIEVKNCRGLCA